MSFLLLKAPDCDPQKKIHSATTHEEVIGLKKVLEGCSFRSVSGQIYDSVCTSYGEGQNIVRPIASNLLESQAGILKFDNEQQQATRELETSQGRQEPACAKEQEVLNQILEDVLVCKLVSPVCLLPECSTVCLHQLEEELTELSLQDAKVDVPVSCVEGDSLKFTQPVTLVEGSSLEFQEKYESPLLSAHSKEVVPLSIAIDVDPTKLKSCLRGCHEKAGLEPRCELHVTWAPDVYDPPCTSTSHTSNVCRRRHHLPRSEHKSRHKGKGSSHSDSRKKSQKKIPRKLKHSSEIFSSGQMIAPLRVLSNTLILKEYIAPLEDLTWKTAKVSPFILPTKGCCRNPMLPFGDRGQATFDKTEGCCLRNVRAHELCS